jgi:hypothetical protein
MAPTGITGNMETLASVDTFIIHWDFGESGSSYNIDVISMTNKTTGENVNIGKPSPLGSMEINYGILDGIQPGVEYTFEISTINCLGAESAYPATYKFSFDSPSGY